MLAFCRHRNANSGGKGRHVEQWRLNRDTHELAGGASERLDRHD
jgi:hypothetical protein